MAIEKLYEFEGYSPLWYMERGHTEPSEFIARLKMDFEDECEGYVKADVEHSHARSIPAGKGRRDIIIYLSKPGRGAYPITYINIEFPASRETTPAIKRD